MAKFFNYFPKTLYTANNDASLDTVTNIISRFSFENNLKENSSVFYEYQIKDGDTPEIIASKYYNNPERHWIVLLFNDIIDPQFDWPLDSRTLIDFIDQKYSANGAANTTPVSGISWAQNSNNIHSYYKIITNEASEGTFSTSIEVDPYTYANIALTSQSYVLADNTSVTQTITKETKTYYEYESELNEQKRSIKLLKPEFVSAVEDEFKKIIK